MSLKAASSCVVGHGGFGSVGTAAGQSKTMSSGTKCAAWTLPAGTLSYTTVLCASDVYVVLEACWLPKLSVPQPGIEKEIWGRAEGEVLFENLTSSSLLQKSPHFYLMVRAGDAGGIPAFHA